MLPARLLCLPVLEDRLALVGVWIFPMNVFLLFVFCSFIVAAFFLTPSILPSVMLAHGPYFLFFCRGFRLVGPMVIMIYRSCNLQVIWHRFFATEHPKGRLPDPSAPFS